MMMVLLLNFVVTIVMGAYDEVMNEDMDQRALSKKPLNHVVADFICDRLGVPKYENDPYRIAPMKEADLMENPTEVADVIEVALADIADSSVVQTCAVRPGPWSLTAPAFCLAGEVIWGASSMILGELAALCHEAGDAVVNL